MPNPFAPDEHDTLFMKLLSWQQEESVGMFAMTLCNGKSISA
jgi:hypothetical protein